MRRIYLVFLIFLTGCSFLSDPEGLDICIETTTSDVPFHQRIGVYDNNNGFVYGQSFGLNQTVAGRGVLDSDGSRIDGKPTQYSGIVYEDIEDKTKKRVKCRKTSDAQNKKIVLPFLKSEVDKSGLYSALGINGQNCRQYADQTFKNLLIILSIDEGNDI